MRKSFILLALVAYACVAVYSLTRIKNPVLTGAHAQAESSSAKTTVAYKLYSNQPAVLMKFYREAFGTNWQTTENGYQGDALNATVQIIATNTRKRIRRTTLTLAANELATHTDNILAAGGTVRTQGKSYVVNDPDGNLILLTRQYRNLN